MGPITTSRLFTVSALMIVARVVGAGLAFLTQVMIARYFGADTLGTYAIALALGGVSAIFAASGFPYIAQRFIAAYRVEGRDDLVAGFLITGRRQLLIGSAVLVTLAWTALALFGGGMEREIRIALALGMLIAPLVGMLAINASVAQSFRRPFLAAMPEGVLKPALVLATVAAVIAVAGTNVTTPTLVALYIAVLALTAGLQTVLIRRRGIITSSATAAVGPRAEWRRAAWPMVALMLFTNYISEIDVLVLGLLMSPDEVAVFSICFRFTAFLAYTLKVIYIVVLPDLAEAHARSDLPGVTRAIGLANATAVASIVAATLVLVFAGRYVLAFVGPEFTAGYGLLIVLALAQVARAALGPSVVLLTLSGHQLRAVPAFIAGFVVMVALNFLLVPTFGLIGAGWAMLAAIVFWSVWLAIITRRLTGYDVSLFALLRRNEAPAV